MDNQSGFIGLRCGRDAQGNLYGQFAEVFVPAHERFRFVHMGGRIVRPAPGLTSDRVCAVQEARRLPEPDPEPATPDRTCRRDGCAEAVFGRRQVCDSCRS